MNVYVMATLSSGEVETEGLNESGKIVKLDVS